MKLWEIEEAEVWKNKKLMLRKWKYERRGSGCMKNKKSRLRKLNYE